MAVRLHALTILAADPARSAQFWSDLLGWEADGVALVPRDGTPFEVHLAPWLEPVVLPTQIHLHLTSNSASQQETVDRALGLGATRVDVGQQPAEDHVVLADPDGQAFCVIEAGNNWLAGTPLLGELACDGTRDVGVFWSEALGWPLVHDEDGEAAIQAPDNGPKVAWGGEPLGVRVGRNRMHFTLVADDLDADIDHLVQLGAKEVGRSEDGDVEMADPDGSEFHVRLA